MGDSDDRALSWRIHDALDTTPADAGFVESTTARLREHASAPRRSQNRRVLTAVLLATAVVAVAGTALSVSLVLRNRTQPSAAATKPYPGGPPAVTPVDAAQRFVWLIGPVTATSGAGRFTNYNVDVIDWTGTLRYHFQLPQPRSEPAVFVWTISADGKRALLADGKVMDEHGHVIATLPLKSLNLDSPGVRWASDDSGVCVAQARTDRTASLDIVRMDGMTRRVATIELNPTARPAGHFPDSSYSVLACDPQADRAILARFRDATPDPANEQTATDQRFSAWMVSMSTGDTLFTQPELRAALGRGGGFASRSGDLMATFLWNSAVPGSEVDVVLQLPSGRHAPVSETEPIPDTIGLSGDGSRILRRLVTADLGTTKLQLLDADDGHVVRQLTFRGTISASAVSDPAGASFIVSTNDQLLLMDGSGGISILRPPVKLGRAPGSVDLSGEAGFQG